IRDRNVTGVQTCALPIYPEVYEKFEQIILVHGVRQVDELAYHDLLVEHLPNHEFLGELVTSKLRYYPTVTREAYRNRGRVTELKIGRASCRERVEIAADG